MCSASRFTNHGSRLTGKAYRGAAHASRLTRQGARAWFVYIRVALSAQVLNRARGLCCRGFNRAGQVLYIRHKPKAQKVLALYIKLISNRGTRRELPHIQTERALK